MATFQKYLMLVGYDYHTSTRVGDRIDFSYNCSKRIDYLIAKNKDKNLSFTVLNVHTGVKYFVTHDGTETKTNYTDPNPFYGTIDSRKDYEKKHIFKRKDVDLSKKISILSLYELIASISDGSLMEVSIFSHGWRGAPVLVNSFDRTGTPMRDPLDLDGRTKDFNRPNMCIRDDRQTPKKCPLDLAKFRSAFHKDGICWLWGCSVEMGLFRFIKLFLLPKYGKSGSSITFSLAAIDSAPTVKSFFRGAYRAQIREATANGNGTEPKTIRLTRDEIKEGIMIYFGPTVNYAQALSNATERKVMAAFPGTGTSHKGRDGLMGVYDPGYASTIRFYQTHFGSKIDPEKRYYGVYSPQP